MHKESLTQNTKRVLETLGRKGLVKDFYLAGGSALALYYGHRYSIDLDWFAESFSNTTGFKKKLSETGKLNINNQDEKTLNASLSGVKISFFEYPYPLISPRVKYNSDVYLAGKPDIAAMKLDAVAARGTYKDFIDIYFLLQEYDLNKLVGFVKKKFSGIEYNETHLFKALTYFEGVKESEMPKMIEPVGWEELKTTIVSAVEKYVKQN